MTQHTHSSPSALARTVGIALISTIVVGIAAAFTLASGIDVNTTGDIAATANNMLSADTALHAKAHIAIVTLALEAVIAVGMYLLLSGHGPLLAGCSLFLSLVAAVIVFMGAVYAINATGLAGNDAFQATDTAPLMKLLVLSDHTTFHLGLIVTTAANAGFYYLFLRSGLIPKLIAGWGLFASLFVITMMVARDYIPALGAMPVTGAFMLSNLIALLTTGLYLAIRGVREAA